MDELTTKKLNIKERISSYATVNNLEAFAESFRIKSTKGYVKSTLPIEVEGFLDLLLRNKEM